MQAFQKGAIQNGGRGNTKRKEPNHTPRYCTVVRVQYYVTVLTSTHDEVAMVGGRSAFEKGNCKRNEPFLLMIQLTPDIRKKLREYPTNLQVDI